MAKAIIDFKETKNYIVVDGVEYEIPQRTAGLEKKIREHDARVPEMTEYEANYSLLQILFGDENAEKMFPDKENANLDKLARCTTTAIKLFMQELSKIKG